MKCEYCGFEGTKRYPVRMREQGRYRKQVPVCEDMNNCLQRQIDNPPKRTEKKILAGVR